MRRIFAGCLLGLIFTGLLVQAQVTTGTISGTVSDSSGAVLPGAKIAILNEGTGVTRDAAADAAGHYTAPSLVPGHYRVTASAEGFQGEVRTGIDLTVGAQAVIDLKLNVGAVSQSVEVAGEAPLVQTTESTVSYLVGDASIRELPLNGRDMTRLILLNPGVSYSVNSAANQSYNGFGKRLSISGSRGEDNIYLMDGSLIADFKRHIPAGPSGSLMGVETVQEFQVLTNSLPAQYGRVLGGVFNAVSKSGTNQMHGDLFEFLRNSDLDARNFFDRLSPTGNPRIPPFRRNQFGGTVGGPIKKDKAFFFVAFEGMRQSLTTTKTTTVPTASARLGIFPSGQVVPVSPTVAPYMSLFPLPSPNGRDFGDGTAQYIFPAGQPTHDNFGQARVDYQYSDKDSFFVRFTGSNSDQTNIVSFPGFVQASSLGSELLTLSETHIYSPTTLATTRFHVNRVVPTDIGIYPPYPQNLLSAQNQPFPPELNVGSGITTEAGFDTTPTYFTSNRFTVQHDINKTIGKHSLQFGGMVERLQLNGEFNDRGMGVWTFSTFQNFLTDTVASYRGSPPGFGTFIRGIRQNFYALYVEDNWRLTPNFTLNLGVRWEPYSVPTEVNGLIANLRHVGDTTGTVGGPYWLNKSWKDIGPRVGLAWSPFASGKTSVRAGFGMLFEPNDPNQYYTQMVRQPPLAYDFTFSTNLAGTFPSALAAIGAQNTPGPGYAVPYDNNKSPRTLQYNFNLQQQIGANSVVSVGYNGSRGINLLTVGNINMPRPVWDGLSLALPATLGLVNPSWSQIVIYANNANSSYNGLVVSVQRKFSAGFQGQIAYTYSKGLSQADSGQTAGGVATGGGYLKNPTDMNTMNGLSGYDFRNIFSANYSYDLPFMKGGKGIAGHILGGWQFTGIFTAQSGQPESVLGAVPAALSAIGAQIVTPNLTPGFNSGDIHSGTTAGCTGVAAGQKLGTPDLYFDPCAFSAPGPRELGNLGRNTLIGPGLMTWDPGLYKDIRATERIRMEFRAEFFNVLNRANFAAPASSVFSAAPATGVASRVGNAGVITSTVTTSRQVQFALKLMF